jgi:hypothetical protein
MNKMVSPCNRRYQEERKEQKMVNASEETAVSLLGRKLS